MPAAFAITGLRFVCLVIAALLASGLIPPAAAQGGAAAGSFSYKNITTDTTTTLKTGPGYLHAVCVNTPAATGTITIYDNTAASGTKIGTLTSFASTVGCFTYDVAFWVGLTIVTATAAPDITVAFR
jgi:hypothetical protein